LTAKIAQMTPSTFVSSVRVWDLPTRAFHWLLAAAVFGALITAWIGGNAMIWHMRLGLAVLALVLFRIVWGLIGGRWSRFASFIYAPGTVLRYLRGESRPGDHFEVGHNPLGSFSVFGLLGFLAVQVATGLVADDEIAFQGPLNRFISSDRGLQATSWHRDFGQWIMLALVVLHIAAIVYYLVRKKTNLVRPMLTGDKPVPTVAADTPASADTIGTRLLGLVVGAACAGFAYWLSRLAT
jgi:cytochrome b